MSVEDLLGKLRESGVADPREVDIAHLESDGEVSVIRRDDRRRGPRPRRRAPGAPR
jgi:uncharacterized membrane protein YcaP (DUF421 family)